MGAMQRITAHSTYPLFSAQATRDVEAAAAAQLPPHTLMQRAGAATARLALALAPHARTVWIACGGGNNGGDGLEAAAVLHAQGRRVLVTCLGAGPQRLPADARASWNKAMCAGVPFTDTPPTLSPQDLCVDALLGAGLSAAARNRSHDERLPQCLAAVQASRAPVLCVDLPSGLLADSGQYAPGLAPQAPPTAARHTLALLTLKPGLFTAHGRDAAGSVWFDALGVDPAATPCAWLRGSPAPSARLHASHKGSFGDVAIVGGEGFAARGMGMTGAALLAASAAVHAGAGRVLVSLLDEHGASAAALAAALPEAMPRRLDALALESLTVVAGCGGGAAIAPALGSILERAPRLVLDADALNAIAAETGLARQLRARQTTGHQATVLTPHPLEAARLLGASTQAVQADRLAAARELAQWAGCTVVLKGSGSVTAAPEQAPLIHPTGNARLATAGTGDVLAGLIGACLAAGHGARAAAAAACWQHGAAADAWPPERALTALRLARSLTPVA